MSNQTTTELPKHKAQPDLTSQDAGLRVLSYILAGLLFYGGLGWLADWYFNTSWFLPIGLILGVGLSLYMVIRRYGSAK